MRQPLERKHWAALLAGSAAMHVLSLAITRPIILPDESGFILNARRIATGTDPSGLTYFPGYSVFIAPATALTTELSALMRIIQLVNIGLGVITALTAVGLARRFCPSLPPSWTVAVALLASATPSFRLFSTLALSENLLIPTTGLLCLAFHSSVAKASGRWAAVAGLLSGLAVSIHPRALALPIALALTTIIVHRSRRRLAGLSALGTLVGVVLSALLVTAVVDTPVDPGTSRRSVSALLTDNASPSGVLEVITSILGQIFYLTISTGGLVALGFVVVVSTLVSSRRQSPAELDAAGAMGLLALSIYLVSLGIAAAFLSGLTGDLAIYGRYTEGVMLPLLVLGIGSVASAQTTVESQAISRTLRLIAVSPIALGAALLLLRGSEAFDGRRLLLNISGIFPLVDAFDDIRLSIIAPIGTLAILGVSFLARRSPSLLFATVGFVYAGLAVFAVARTAEAIEVLDAQDQLVSAIDEASKITASDCVALDIWLLPDRWHQENLRLRLADQRFTYWSIDAPEAPCSDLIVSQRPDLDDRFPGATVIAVEPSGRLALWALPGTTQARLSDAGVEQASDALDPLPQDQTFTLELVLDADTTPEGGAFSGSVTITNNGPATVFPDAAFDRVLGAVNGGVEFRATADIATRLHEPVRLRLDEMLHPGEHTTISFTVPEGVVPLGPGERELVVSMVQEGLAWFPPSDQARVVITVGQDG